MLPESLLLTRDPAINREDLERNKRFTENFLTLILSYDSHKSTETAGKSK
jgi:hypothetical protein